MSQFSKVKMILNPRAGGGRAGKLTASALKLLASKSIKAEVLNAESPAASQSAAMEAIRDGCDLLICVGGDGLINNVLPSIVHSDVPLGIIPAGTGNDLARSLGISRDITEAVDTIARGQIRTIDVGLRDGNYFHNIASSGLDAAVAADFNNRKHGTGAMAYILSVIRVLPRFKPCHFDIQLDGESVEFDGMLVAVANTKSYGGGMLIAPEASPADGLFDVVMLESMSKLEFIRCFPRVFTGKHLKHPRVKIYRAAKVRIDANPQQLVMADGDVANTTPANFEVVPGALRVVT